MLRTTAAIVAGKTARVAARVRGGGSAMPGLVAEWIDPQFLAHALSGLTNGIVVVTGTNGKTTTTKMLAAILRAHGKRVFSNPTGSNFTRGVISAMLGDLPLNGRLEADVAVLELDEWHALQFAKVVRPTHSLLLNVARDQLDRFAEIDMTAKLLGSLASMTSTGVVRNRDDSFVARLDESQFRPGVTTRWFGIDPAVADDLPPLHEVDARFDDAFAPPEPSPDDGMLHPKGPAEFRIDFGPETVGPLVLKQRGLAAMINATAAATTARLMLGEAFRPAVADEALRAVLRPSGAARSSTPTVTRSSWYS